MTVTVVGGGLAGCEAALQLAQRGHQVRLIEMRPVRGTEAHQTDNLGELVCTNSFKSEGPANAHGQLKREMRALGSLLLRSADQSRVAAGSALAVDRGLFSQAMTDAVEAEPLVEVVREECTRLPEGPAIIATGPLTSDALSRAIQECLGDGGLAFFDAIAPIVHRDSLDESVVFEAGRFDEDSDYLNCPMSEPEYVAFIEALNQGEAPEGHDWDVVPYFEGCLPVEVMASRGLDTLRFGPMKPIGLTDPRTGERPWAVVQLRREDRAGQMWNMVGFQTRLGIGEQRRVFTTIPGLGDADFLRWGSIHRNSYLNFPERLARYGAPAAQPDLLFAGQLTGVEGYTESAASGILAGINLSRLLAGEDAIIPPPTTVLGGLFQYLSEAKSGHFQPMNSNWGLVEPLPKRIKNKKERRERLGERAQEDFLAWMAAHGLS
ncbi:MAG: methylenetetrahydrofolate--tRNA-(uracil(54)-C(5))-methyltransferase (FADH(2)-oxidizing) TrmFO [Gemmatimonadota bacterium]|nr:methylenetetrahydrofolate--tRNA-(uracil(54)-C(5))-methyltransferase (FADH(2)-oxidizing) TrmFO [Gemmatimonadota bacterium]